jgi:hypothetical protein
MKKIVLISVVVFVFVACKDRGNKKDLTLTRPGSLSTQLNSSQSNAGKSTAQLPVGNTVSGLRVNPEHGKPGHRCDLAVGAPLDNVGPVPVTNTVSQVTPTQTPISTTINQLASSSPAQGAKPAAATSAGPLNPAHGQPGHRCDISVGAPLSSAPAVKQNTPLPSASIKPVNNPVTTAPGMNPQHGQPGHRCDIAVGAPLNSAPAKVEEKKDTTAKS